MNRYFIIHKPYNVLSQFTSQDGKSTLADYYNFPSDVYPVGRLDYDSEGLLLLTNDTVINHKLLNPFFNHEREYWVQVEGKINIEALHQLQKGVSISNNGNTYLTKPCFAKILEHSEEILPRVPPIRYRKTIPDSWISLTLTEGKNRQVRKMTAKVGFPTLRLIRYRIGQMTLRNIMPGKFVEINRQQVEELIFKKS